MLSLENERKRLRFPTAFLLRSAVCRHTYIRFETTTTYVCMYVIPLPATYVRSHELACFGRYMITTAGTTGVICRQLASVSTSLGEYDVSGKQRVLCETTIYYQTRLPASASSQPSTTCSRHVTPASGADYRFLKGDMFLKGDKIGSWAPAMRIYISSVKWVDLVL